VSWCDDVVVLDSCSSDRTVAIAAERGARVVSRRFDNYANQRNFALKQIEYRHRWLLMLDADERVTPDLRREMQERTAADGNEAACFQMRRRDHLFGRWIRRSSGYPTWFGRLMQPGRVSVERSVNEEYVVDGRVERLRHHLDHFPFNKGFSEWIRKHDRYSTMEASIKHSSQRSAAPRELVSSDPVRRRRALKAWLYAMPFRPAIVFVGLYVVRGGIVEGVPGLTFCLLRAWYEFMIDCKERELRRRDFGLQV
jgi:glycosyltransferase involved in cell wall biosynthesis